MTSQNGVLDDVKDNLDVPRIHSSGEVAIKVLGLILAHRVEHAHQIVLHIVKIPWVPFKVRKEVFDTLVLNLLDEKVGLVEKQNDRNSSKAAIIDYCVKYVNALDHTICDSVLQQGLVK